MQLYHATPGPQPDGGLTHFGTLMAAVHRLETLFVFSSRETRLFRDGRFHIKGPMVEWGIVPDADRVRRIETPGQHVRSFTDFRKGVTFYKTTLAFQKVLPLQDCWGNDPIGSGGMDIIGADSGLDEKQRARGVGVFFPFTGVINPEQIFFQIRPAHITRMERLVRANGIFKVQLDKRRARLGEAVYALDHAAEVVWQYMT